MSAIHVTPGHALIAVSAAILVFAMVMLIKCLNTHSSPAMSEAFVAPCAHSWGYDGPKWSGELSSATKRTVGPDPTKRNLLTWQYHPQNTLVDYRFYQTESTCNDNPVRIAPIADGRIGKKSGPVPISTSNAQYMY